MIDDGVIGLWSWLDSHQLWLAIEMTMPGSSATPEIS